MVQFSLHAHLDLWETHEHPRMGRAVCNNERALSFGAQVALLWDPATKIAIWEAEDLFLPAEETWHYRIYNI